VRYPRGSGRGLATGPGLETLPIGVGEVRREGRGIALLAFGSLLTPALAVGEALDATVANMRFVKPLDEDLIEELAATHELVVTLEENAVAGGAGSAVAEVLARRGILVRCLHLGLPDVFLDQASPEEQLVACGLDAAGIETSVRAAWESLSAGAPGRVAAAGG
jgi:1-deoxy-D-xylulose-5-phosphate synthase